MFGSPTPPVGGAATTTEVEGPEVDAPWLTLKKPTLDVAARLFPPVELARLPAHCHLLEVLNEKGIFVAAGSTSFGVYKLEKLEELLAGAQKGVEVKLEPEQTVDLDEQVVWLRFTSDGSTLITSTASSTIRLFTVASLLAPGVTPTFDFPPLPSALTLLLPNPMALPSSVLLLSPSSLAVLDIATRAEVFTLHGSFTAASWSAKGKQLAVGSSSGVISFVSPTGAPASNPIPLPPSLAVVGPYEVVHLAWLENDLFLASYNPPTPPGDDEPTHEVETFFIDRARSPAGSPLYTFTKFTDPLPAYGLRERAEARFGAWLGSWGSSKHLGFIGTTSSPVVGAFSAGPPFALLMLEEASAPSLPLTEAGDDVSLLGMALDLRSIKPLKRGLEGGEELADLPPAPRLLALTSEGVVAVWEIWNTEAGKYDGMVAVGAGASTAAAPTAAATTPSPAAAPSPFGAPSAFSATSAFGSSAPSAFGSTSPLSAPAKPATSPFGATSSLNAPSSAFAAPSTFGATSAFGAAASKPTSSAFGVPAAAPSAFSAGGMPTFGRKSATTSAFGQPAVAGGSSSAFGSASSAFGAQKPSTSAFGGGAPSPPPIPPTSGASAFGATSTFGASTPAFGTSAISGPKIAPIAAPAGGGFGGFSAGPAKGGFAGFGPQAKKDQGTSVFSADQSATPAKPPTASAFGGSPSAFGAGGPSAFGASTSAFGASPSSAFGSGPAFGATSAFGSSTTFGTPGSKPSVAPETPKTPASAFGTPASIFGATSAFGGAAKASPSAFEPMGAPSPTEAKVIELSPKSTPPGSPRSAPSSPASGAASPPGSPSGSAEDESDRSAPLTSSPSGSPSATPAGSPSKPAAADLDLGSLGLGSAAPQEKSAAPAPAKIASSFDAPHAGKIAAAPPTPAEDKPFSPPAATDEVLTPPPAEPEPKGLTPPAPEPVEVKAPESAATDESRPSAPAKAPERPRSPELPLTRKDHGFADFETALGSALSPAVEKETADEAAAPKPKEVSSTSPPASPLPAASPASTPPSSPPKRHSPAPEKATSKTTPSTSIFGAQIKPAAASPFGASSMTFGSVSSAFGTPSAFGAGKPSGPSASGGLASATPSEPATSPSAVPVPPAFAYGSTPAFGASTIGGPKIAPIASPAGGGFGGFSAGPALGGFAVFGQAAKSPSMEPTSIFGKETSAKSAASPLAESNPSLSAFGSTTSFGAAPKMSSPLASPPSQKPPASTSSGFGTAAPKFFGEASTTPAKPPPATSAFGGSPASRSVPSKPSSLFGASSPATTTPSAFSATPAPATSLEVPASIPLPASKPNTPNHEPDKPAFSFGGAPAASSLFGGKPSVVPTEEEASSDKKDAPEAKAPFGFGSKPATSPFGVPLTSPFGASKDSAPPSLFGAQPAAEPSTKPAASAPAFSASLSKSSALGFGLPPSTSEAFKTAAPAHPSATDKQSALGQGQPPTLSSTPPFGASPPAAAVPAPTSSAALFGAPAKPTTAPVVALAPPAGGAAKPARKSQAAVDIGGLAGQFLRAYLTTSEEIEDLKETAAGYRDFQKDAGTPHAVKGDFDSATSFSLGDLVALTQKAKAKEAEASKTKEEGLLLRKRILEVQSLMLQADTKAEEAARFIAARHDPKVLELMRARQLGPEVAETQQRLRAQQKLVSERVEQLEAQLQALHKLVLTAKRGAQPLKAPTLDTISRSIRHITMAINQRMYEIDDLSLRFDMSQISSPAPKRRAPAPAALLVPAVTPSSAVAELPAATASSPLRDVLTRPAVQEKVASLAARALNDERKLVEVRSLLLKVRKTPIKTTAAPVRASAALGYKDPKMTTPPPASSIGPSEPLSLTTPRKFTPVDGPKVAAAVSRPAAQSPLTMGCLASPPPKFSVPLPAKLPTSKLAQPPLNFSSLNAPPPTTFNTLDPAAFEPSSLGEDHDSGSGSRRRGKASSHASAPKFVAPKDSAVKAPSPASSFSFGPPPPLPKSNLTQAPSLFSFAGAPSAAKPLVQPQTSSKSAAAPTGFTGFAGFGAPVKKGEEEPPAADEEHSKDEDDGDSENYGEDGEGEDYDEEDGEYVYNWEGNGEGDEDESSEEGYDG